VARNGGMQTRDPEAVMYHVVLPKIILSLTCVEKNAILLVL